MRQSYEHLAWVSPTGIITEMRPGPRLLLVAIYKQSGGGNIRFAVLRDQAKRLWGFDVWAVNVVNTSPFIDTSHALKEYQEVDQAIVACVLRATQTRQIDLSNGFFHLGHCLGELSKYEDEDVDHGHPW